MAAKREKKSVEGGTSHSENATTGAREPRGDDSQVP